MNILKKYAGVAGVVYLDENPKLIAVVQTKRGYSLPGGSLEEEDNSIEQAMYRELKEELGLLPEDVEIYKTDYDEVFKYDSGKAGRENQQTTRAVFLIKANKKELKPQDEEVIVVKWYTYDEAMEILTWNNAKETLKKVI